MHRHAHRHRHAQPLRRQLRHHRLRRPPRQPPPRRRLHRPLRLLHLLLRVPPGHGERAGDAVRAGVRRGAGGDAGRLPAALLDRPHRRLAPHGALLRAGRAAAAGHRPGRRRGARGGALRILPGGLSFSVNFPTAKFLQAQRKVLVLAWVGVAGLGLHVALTYLLVAVLGWGLPGAAAAYDASLWAIALAQAAYIVGWCTDGWRGWSMAAFHDMWAFVRLSLESAVMLCLEIWYIGMITVLTGHLQGAQIAVDSLGICMNVNGWEGMIFIGLNAAISVRVSNELGSGRPRAAKHAVIVVVGESLLIGLLCMALVLIFRDSFSVIYTSDSELQHAVSRIAGLLGLTMVLNSVQPVLSGVAIGGGWQGLVAYINLGCYYIFGLPLGYLLGHKFDYGVGGIWAGMLCGIALQTLILSFIVWRTDWDAEAALASSRVRKWGGADATKPLLE